MSDFWGGLIAAAGNIGGAIIGSNAASNAADTTGKYNLQAQQAIIADNEKARAELRAAAARGVGYIDTGTQQYADTINPLLDKHGILMPTNRGLTNQQRIGLEDLRRSTGAQLATSGLRGAGRAGVAVGLDQERRYIAGARAANDADTMTERRRADSVGDTARTNLAGIRAAAGGAKAATEVGTGNSLASNYASQGVNTGNLIANTGSAYANAAQASGNLWGNALTGTAKVLGQGVGAAQANAGSPNSQYQPSALFSGWGDSSAEKQAA